MPPDATIEPVPLPTSVASVTDRTPALDTAPVNDGALSGASRSKSRFNCVRMTTGATAKLIFEPVEDSEIVVRARTLVPVLIAPLPFSQIDLSLGCSAR